MRQRIISILMAIAIILTTVDISVFASELTVSGTDVQSVVEEMQILTEEETEFAEEQFMTENDARQEEEKVMNSDSIS